MNCSFLYRECIWLCLVDYYHTLIVNKMFNKTSFIARFKCSVKYLINSLKLSITLVLSRDYSVMLCSFILVLYFFQLVNPNLLTQFFQEWMIFTIATNVRKVTKGRDLCGDMKNTNVERSLNLFAGFQDVHTVQSKRHS